MSDNGNMESMDLTNTSNEYDVFDEVVEEGDFDELSADDNTEDASQDSEEESSEDIEESSDEIIEDDSEESDGDSEEEVEEDSEEESEEEKEEVEPSEALQQLNEKLESGDLEIQLDDESLVTLKELKNNHVTSKEIARKFSELDVEKKAVQKDVAEIEGYINDFAGKLRDGDSVGAMQFFGEFAGVPPYMVKEQLIAALRPEIIRREQMNATDIQNEYLQQQNEYLQQQRESDNERRAMEQSQTELQNSINEIRETHGIDGNTWDEALDFVGKNLEEGEELTPELVRDFVISERNFQQAASVVQSFEGELDNKEQWAERLADVKEQYPHFTEEDLKEVLQSAYDTVSKQNTEQKLAKKVSSKKAQPKKQQPKSQSDLEDDIDPELEDWL
jgi:hypothetical protein